MIFKTTHYLRHVVKPRTLAVLLLISSFWLTATALTSTPHDAVPGENGSNLPMYAGYFVPSVSDQLISPFYPARSNPSRYVLGQNAPVRSELNGPATSQAEQVTIEIDADTTTIAPTILRNDKKYNVQRRRVGYILLTIRVSSQNGPEGDYPLEVRVTAAGTGQTGGHDHGNKAPARPHGWLFAQDKELSSKQENKQIAAWGPSGSTKEISIEKTLTKKDGDNKGSANIFYYPPEISGKETITVTSLKDRKVTKSIDITVKQQDAEGNDFVSLPASNAIELTGATAAHGPGTNHYGTKNMVKAVEALAINYLAVTGKKLAVNDMSLEWGGLFDIGPTNSKSKRQFWKPPHTFHRDGKQADIELVAKPPNKVFEAILVEQGWWRTDDIAKKLWIAEKNHYHIFLDDSPQTGGGKVQVRHEVKTNEIAWQGLELRVPIVFTNTGGLPATDVIITSVSASNGIAVLEPVPIHHLGELPIRLPIRQPEGLDVRLGALPPEGTTFTLTVEGKASNGSRAFDIKAINKIVVPAR